MKKQYKVGIASVLVMVLILCSIVPVYATTTSSTQYELVTKYNDGRIVTSTYTYPSNSSRSLSNESNLIAPAYETSNTYINTVDENDNGIMLLADNYGRTHLTGSNVDQRVGQLECLYDVSGNGVIDTISFGTASLQNHDILISCAHVVWKGECKNLLFGGWPIQVTYYSGRTSEVAYSATSPYYSITISSNYMDSFQTVFDNNGNATISENQAQALQEDWSILQIQNDLGSIYGWHGLHGCGAPAENNLAIEVIGYPEDHEYQQWSAAGNITSFNGNIVRYSSYGVNGLSGAPVLNGGYVYGIHTHHSGASSLRNSGGIRMFPLLFNLIVSRREESTNRWE